MVPPAATASTPVESLCGGFLQRTNLASCAASRCSRKCISNPGFIYIECAAPLPPPFSPQHRHIPTVSSSSLPVWLPSLGHTRFVSYSASHVNDLNRPPSALFSLPSFRPLFHAELRPPYWKRRGDQSLLFICSLSPYQESQRCSLCRELWMLPSGNCPRVSCGFGRSRRQPVGGTRLVDVKQPL